SAEPYVSQTNLDLSAMTRFISSRERNAVSALYQVEESPDPEVLAARAGSMFVDPLDVDLATQFVKNPVRLWYAGLGSHFNQNQVGDEYGFHNQDNGFQLGLVKERGDGYFGLTGAYNRANARWTELQAHNKTDTYMGELLFGVRRDWGFMEVHGNLGYADHEMTRSLQLGAPLNGSAYDVDLDCDPFDNYYNGVYDVTQIGDYATDIKGGGFRLGYQKVLLDKWLFLPTLGLTYMEVANREAFTEKGPDNAAFRLLFEKDGIKRQTLQVPLFFRLSRGIAFNNGGPFILTPEFRFGATANLLDRSSMSEFKFIGNPIPNRYMKAWGIREDRVAYQAGASLELSRRGRMYLALNYDLFLQNKSVNHAYSAQFGVNF
ncbi:MAG: autotransporter outer membrane beta-barrel domain-containing protein, partial [Planctomycetota bacterium]|nr:autotransporter outer membrane beta-barrel domain-containing protein [Planctomycetota bacterium]